MLADGPYPHFDVERLWRFILDSLAALNRERPVDAISVTTHGATAALLDANGDLALPVLDYEHRRARTRWPPTMTRCGRLLPKPARRGCRSGLNIGAQIFWQAATFPDAFRKRRGAS